MDTASQWRASIAMLAVIGSAAQWGTSEYNWNPSLDTIGDDSAASRAYFYHPGDSDIPADERPLFQSFANLQQGVNAAVSICLDGLGDIALRTIRDGNPVDGAYAAVEAMMIREYGGNLRPQDALAAVRRIYAVIPEATRAAAGLPVPAFNNTPVAGTPSTRRPGTSTPSTPSPGTTAPAWDDVDWTSGDTARGDTSSPGTSSPGTSSPDTSSPRGDTTTPTSAAADDGGGLVVGLLLLAALAAASED